MWCSQVNFCSVPCRDAALSSYHSRGKECKVAQLLLRDAGLNENAVKAFRYVSYTIITKMFTEFETVVFSRHLTCFGLRHLKEKLDNGKATPDPTWGSKGEFVYTSLDFLNSFHHFGAETKKGKGTGEHIVSAQKESG